MAILVSFFFFFIKSRVIRKTGWARAGVFILLVIYGTMLDFYFHILVCPIEDVICVN